MNTALLLACALAGPILAAPQTGPAADTPQGSKPAAGAVGKGPGPRKEGRHPSKEELAAGIDTGVLIIKKDQKGRDKTVRRKTSDGWWIVFSYRAPRKGRPVAVLAHGYGSGRAEWAGLAADLQAKGWGTLALDLRGHGDSRTGPAGRVDFNYIDAKGGWNEAVRDIELALGFLRGEKIPARRTCLVGASLGANIAASAAVSNPGLACAVLLSPGRNYRGVALEEDPRPKAPTLVAASPDDPYAYQTLVGFRAARTSRTLLEGSRGHGVEMLRDADFDKELLGWLESAVKQ